MTDEVSEGWYEDPRDPLRERRWDGDRWTDEVRERPPKGGSRSSRDQPLELGREEIAYSSTPERLFSNWTGQGALMVVMAILLGSALIGLLRDLLDLGDSLSYVVLPTPAAVLGTDVADIAGSIAFLFGLLALLGAYRTSRTALPSWIPFQEAAKSRNEYISVGLAFLLASYTFTFVGDVLYMFSDFRNGSSALFFAIQGLFLVGAVALAIRAIGSLSDGDEVKIGGNLAFAAAVLAVAFAFSVVGDFAEMFWLQSNFVELPGSVSAEPAIAGFADLILVLAALIASIAFRQLEVQQRDTYLCFASATVGLAFLLSAISYSFSVRLGFFYEYSGWDLIGYWFGLIDQLILVAAGTTLALSFALNNRARNRKRSLEASSNTP
jgi:hypothetical protein